MSQIELYAVERLQDVMDRWGYNEPYVPELFQTVDGNDKRWLPVYILASHPRVNPDTNKPVYFCRLADRNELFDPGKYRLKMEDFLLNSDDVKRYEEKFPQRTIWPRANLPESWKSQLDKALEKIKDLEEELAEEHNKAQALQKENAALTARPTTLPATPRTNPATEKRVANEFAKWKEEYSPAMVKVALACGKEGEKKRQANDFNKMFKDLGTTLPKGILKLFRSWLPGEHTDKIGGAPRT